MASFILKRSAVKPLEPMIITAEFRYIWAGTASKKRSKNLGINKNVSGTLSLQPKFMGAIKAITAGRIAGKSCRYFRINSFVCLTLAGIN